MRTEVPAGSSIGVPSGISITRQSRWVMTCSVPDMESRCGAGGGGAFARVWGPPPPPPHIPEGGMIGRVDGSREIVLARVRGEVFAMDDVCTHAGAFLHEGE